MANNAGSDCNVSLLKDMCKHGDVNVRSFRSVNNYMYVTAGAALEKTICEPFFCLLCPT